MLTPKQKEHFDVFGFLCLRQAFSPDEMAEITQAADQVWHEDRGGQPDDGQHQGLAPFAELNPRLLDLAEDDRIFQVVADLLGDDFLWSGSEGNKEGHTEKGEHNWHADRPGAAETEYRRLKVMIYLTPTTKEQGALRVIPGSHRMPFHQWLWPLQSHHFKDGTIGDSFGAREARTSLPARWRQRPATWSFSTTASFTRPTASSPSGATLPSSSSPGPTPRPSCGPCSATHPRGL